ncbi:MAG: SPOR domain-containing protein [Acidobacteriia bacterium]|nr:SPOR domain-containing protein [Terriglobia bacterium]
MTTAGPQDTEITLGTGKMLALFFALVVLCAVFFGMGFSLGRSTVKVEAGEAQATAPATTAAVRPSAVKSAANTPAPEMTFYKAVGQKDADSQLTTNDADKTASAPASAPAPAENKPSSPDPMVLPATAGYYVQVAAVSKQEDAEALVDALKKKQYPAFANNNAPSDKLFHVQVGPFVDIKDAEGMRAKLVSDGYNPILKK